MPKHPNDSNSSSRSSWAWLCFPFYSSLPLSHERSLWHLMTWWSSGTPFWQENHCTCAEELPWFICAPAGIHAKQPFIMKVCNIVISFLNPFLCLWHSPPGILVHSCTVDYFINKNLNMGRNKQINYNVGKIMWVNAQSNHHKNIFTVTIVSLQLKPPSWGSWWI